MADSGKGEGKEKEPGESRGKTMERRGEWQIQGEGKERRDGGTSEARGMKRGKGKEQGRKRG
eukprot:3721418-Pleurochrysis_carterae.AAC.1